MERTIYTDGVEVDASDLTNTEDTKVNEILLTRRVVARYGVIDGLGVSNVANSATIDTGRLVFRNGEVGILDSPIAGIAGASFAAGVRTFLGLRLTEVTSNPKPHEVDPTLFDTRALPKLVAEQFVASDQTEDARQKALKAAVDAELNDANFVLLAELVGNGTGFDIFQQTPGAKSKGGTDPFRFDTKTKTQIGSLVGMYLADQNEQYPIESAEDHFHRSLVGSGLPQPKNPHGTTLSDIGGDAILNQVIAKHQNEFHANGIIGFEPGDTTVGDPVGDFTPVSGSFSFGTDAFGTVTIHDLIDGDTLVIQGHEFQRGHISTFVADIQRISFSGQPAGLYYIVAKYASTDQQPTFESIQKNGPGGTFSVPGGLDSLCVNNNGVAVWPNNAVDTDGERKFYVIGLVQWNGTSQFTNLTGAPGGIITIPGPNGGLIYKAGLPVGHPFLIPVNQKTLDLRRWGVLTNEQVEKRTLRLDRLEKVIITEDDFIVHAGIRIINGSPVVVGGAGLRAIPGVDDSVLKHLTDFNAFDLFGHRQRIGTAQHGVSQHSATDATLDALVKNAANPSNEDGNNSGFQSSRDKWRQDNLTMTIFKWADLQDVQGAATQRAIGDAAAVSGGNPDIGVVGAYGTVRTGVMKNFCICLRTRPASGSHTLDVFVLYGPAGGALTKTQVAAIGAGADNFFLFVAEPVAGGIVISGDVGTPWVFKISREKSDTNTGWHDLTVTAEFHYTS